MRIYRSEQQKIETKKKNKIQIENEFIIFFLSCKIGLVIRPYHQDSVCPIRNKK